VEETTDRVYLPIMWTSYYKAADFGNNGKMIRRLQWFLNTLDKAKKYYTICQFDDGILNTLGHLDCKVFSMSGLPMDYPLPLLCKTHSFTAPVGLARDFFVNFVGKNTHPIRSEILNFRIKHWFIDDNHHKMDFYCRVLATSVFTLCPRGYGPASFRVGESMQYGSIPVYISDKFIIPHLVPFNRYGVLVRPEQIDKLPEILHSIDISEKQAAVREAYDQYYTFEANRLLIQENARS
jgi:hypothetical protein